MVQWYHSWVDKMPSSLPWKFAQYLQVLWKLGHRKEAFTLYPTQVILVVGFKCEGSFARGLLSTSERQPQERAIAYIALKSVRPS